jgi:hypothetical protein
MAVGKRRLSVSNGTSVVMEVVVWLRSLGLGWYEGAFRGGERFRKLMKRPVGDAMSFVAVPIG